jgi:type I restriction enzyme, S subunit
MMIIEAKKLPEGWRWVKLKDIARLERGKFSPRPRNDPRYYKGAYPWIQTGDVEAADKYIKTYRNTLNEVGLAVSKMFPKGTLIITIAATIGAVGILTFDSCMPDSVVAITPKEGVSDTEFLYYLLLFLRKEVKAKATQSAQANINLELLEPIEIPLPPLAEQKRIVAIAQKADRLRRTRRYALQLSDTYLQSVFLEMFGDPIANPKGWEIVKLSSLGELDRGRSKHRPRNAPKLFGGSYPFIQTGDVANSAGYIRTYKQTYSELGLKQSKLWTKGTLCITIAANIAKTGILTFDACFPDSIVGFSPNEKTNTEVIQQWFNFIQQNLEETAPESYFSR